MESKIQKRLLSTAEAAKYLSCSTWKLRELVHNEEVPHVVLYEDDKYWRFDVADLNKFVESRSKLGA